MAKNKTTENTSSVEAYLDAIADEGKRDDCATLIKLMQKQTASSPKMWGTSIVGFGSYHYKYESGHEGDAPLAALAARSNAIVLYLSLDPDERLSLLEKLGKFKTGKGCLYIKKLEDVDQGVLSVMIKKSVQHLKSKYPQ